MPFEIRAESASCEVSRLLLKLMARKKSNLCVAADVLNASELVALAKKVGPHICLLKTHVDLSQGFTQDIADELISLAKHYDFLILEDRYLKINSLHYFWYVKLMHCRKYADIGSTVAQQYSRGYFEVSRWADIVTVHSLPGDGILKAIETEANKLETPRGCFLLAEMSSEGNLISADYTKGR